MDKHVKKTYRKGPIKILKPLSTVVSHVFLVEKDGKEYIMKCAKDPKSTIDKLTKASVCRYVEKIVEILADGKCFLVEKIKGPTLDSFLQIDRDPKILEQISSKLICTIKCLHSLGLFHSDLHSKNIIIEEGTNDPYLIDLDTITVSFYLPPEYFLNPAYDLKSRKKILPNTWRSDKYGDLWNLGLILFQIWGEGGESFPSMTVSRLNDYRYRVHVTSDFKMEGNVYVNAEFLNLKDSTPNYLRKIIKNLLSMKKENREI